MSTKNPNSILAQMMESGEFSDLKFTCNGQEFKVHKAIVCMQSSVIKAATKGGFEESDTNVIAMDNFQPNAVRRLVQFMYTGDYDDFDDHEDQHEALDQPTSVDSSDEIGKEVAGLFENELQLVDSEDNIREHSKGPPVPSPPKLNSTASLFEHIHVNSIGDYYGIDRLVSLANTKIRRLLGSDNEDQSWVTSLPCATDAAVRSTGDDELLGILASATAAHISTLLESGDFTRLGVVTDFSIKVMQSCAKEIQVLAEEREKNKFHLRQAYEQIWQSKSEIFRLEQCLRILRDKTVQEFKLRR